MLTITITTTRPITSTQRNHVRIAHNQWTTPEVEITLGDVARQGVGVYFVRLAQHVARHRAKRRRTRR